jgi:hypothetical protein
MPWPPSGWNASHDHRAPFSPRSRRRVRQHSVRRAPRPAPLCRLALRLLVQGDARCVGPTSAISRYRTSTRASSALDASNACALARSRRSPASRSGRFASVGRTFLLPESRRGGRCLPAVTRANRTSDAPVASLTMATPLARMRQHEGRQDHPPRTRVNEVRCRSDPGCLPSSKDPRPATPSRAPGLGLRPRGGLAAATLTIDAFSPPPTLSSRREPGPRPRAPLPAGGALL